MVPFNSVLWGTPQYSEDPTSSLKTPFDPWRPVLSNIFDPGPLRQAWRPLTHDDLNDLLEFRTPLSSCNLDPLLWREIRWQGGRGRWHLWIVTRWTVSSSEMSRADIVSFRPLFPTWTSPSVQRDTTEEGKGKSKGMRGITKRNLRFILCQ